MKKAVICKNNSIGNDQQGIKLYNFNKKHNKSLKFYNSWSSETTRATSFFNQWAAGLIESDGCIYISKKGYISYEVTMGIREIAALYKLKAVFGGSVSKRVNANAFRWRLHKDKFVYRFTCSINGYIYMKELNYKKVLDKYNLNFFKVPLVYDNAWLSGFFEGDGSVNINIRNYQITLSISQKSLNILEQIQSIYGGIIYYDKSWDGYVWAVSESESLEELLLYFTRFPLKSGKNADIRSAKRFYGWKLQGYHKASTKKKKLDLFIKQFQKRKKI